MRCGSAESAGGAPVYAFEVNVGTPAGGGGGGAADDGGEEGEPFLRCFSAQLSAPPRGRGLPHYLLSVDLEGEAKAHYVRVTGPGKYVLFRSSTETSWLSFGSDKQEELAAFVFSEVVRGVHSMEVLLPRASARDSLTASAATNRVSSATDSNGLLRLHGRGRTDSLTVLVGRVEVKPPRPTSTLAVIHGD